MRIRLLALPVLIGGALAACGDDEQTDVDASNDIIQVIDGVLLPG
jgi:hypothetical protein